jgi:hypothetical protein
LASVRPGSPPRRGGRASGDDQVTGTRLGAVGDRDRDCATAGDDAEGHQVVADAAGQLPARRLSTAGHVRPELALLVALADALGAELRVVPQSGSVGQLIEGS